MEKIEGFKVKKMNNKGIGNIQFYEAIRETDEDHIHTRSFEEIGDKLTEILKRIDEKTEYLVFEILLKVGNPLKLTLGRVVMDQE